MRVLLQLGTERYFEKSRSYQLEMNANHNDPNVGPYRGWGGPVAPHPSAPPYYTIHSHAGA